MSCVGLEDDDVELLSPENEYKCSDRRDRQAGTAAAPLLPLTQSGRDRLTYTHRQKVRTSRLVGEKERTEGAESVAV